MLQQMCLNVPEFTAIHMDQLPADFADTMEMRGTLLIFGVSITRTLTRTENKSPYTSVFNKPLQLAVYRRRTDGLVLRSKVILNFCGSKMSSGCSFQEFQEFFLSPCPIGHSLSHRTHLPFEFENRFQLYACEVRLSIRMNISSAVLLCSVIRDSFYREW